VQFSYNRILTVADFQKWLYMYGVGHPVKLMIVRNGTELSGHRLHHRRTAAVVGEAEVEWTGFCLSR